MEAALEEARAVVTRVVAVTEAETMVEVGVMREGVVREVAVMVAKMAVARMAEMTKLTVRRETVRRQKMKKMVVMIRPLRTGKLLRRIVPSVMAKIGHDPWPHQRQLRSTELIRNVRVKTLRGVMGQQQLAHYKGLICSI